MDMLESRYIPRSSEATLSAGGEKAVAFLEAVKGGLVLLAGFGLFTLIHRDAQTVAEEIVAHFHLNPANRFPQIFIALAGKLSDTRLRWLAAGAAVYAFARFIEAYGLWRSRKWAEWFAAASAGIYLPFEFAELMGRHPTITLAAVLINLAVLIYMIQILRNRRERHPAIGK